MAEFELDQLFGLALTDARFFRQLREHPGRAVAQFQLTDSETQAVLNIAPAVTTVQELAVELDVWMTRVVADTVPAPLTEPILAVDPLRHQRSLSDHRGFDQLEQERPHIHHPGTTRAKA